MIYISDRNLERKRLRIYELVGNCLKFFLSPGNHVYKINEGIPLDAEFLYAFVDNETGNINLVFEHSSFPEVLEGLYIPKDNIIITTGVGVLAEEVKKYSFDIAVHEVLQGESK